MKALVFEVSREAYGIEQVNRTMTVGELVALLQEYDEDRLVILSHDNGYTFGGIREADMYDVDLEGEEDE